MLDQLIQLSKKVQEICTVDGGIYVDLMCIVIVVRLLAVLFHCQPLNMAEAGLWASTISVYGYSKKKQPKDKDNDEN